MDEHKRLHISGQGYVQQDPVNDFLHDSWASSSQGHNNAFSFQSSQPTPIQDPFSHFTNSQQPSYSQYGLHQQADYQSSGGNYQQPEYGSLFEQSRLLEGNYAPPEFAIEPQLQESFALPTSYPLYLNANPTNSTITPQSLQFESLPSHTMDLDTVHSNTVYRSENNPPNLTRTETPSYGFASTLQRDQGSDLLKNNSYSPQSVFTNGTNTQELSTLRPDQLQRSAQVIAPQTVNVLSQPLRAAPTSSLRITEPGLFNKKNSSKVPRFSYAPFLAWTDDLVSLPSGVKSKWKAFLFREMLDADRIYRCHTQISSATRT